MPLDTLRVNDPRAKRCTAHVRGQTYHYLHAIPRDRAQPVATLFLIHGWPDISYGWRHQIPMLLDLGLQVVAPDLMGFGGTDAPHVQPDSGHLSTYSLKRASDDIAALASLLHVDRFILGGHDWGGAVVYRVALWHPERVTGIFSVCTPYNAPSKTFVSLDQVVQRAPQFGYQKHLAGPEVEAEIKGKVQLRRFLNGMYGARTATKESLFDPKIGINFRVLPELGKSKLLTDEEMVYYVDEYDRHGMHGTLNWYRTRKVNHEEELGLQTKKITVPVLFVAADNDDVLLPSMSQGMESHIPNLTRRNVPASHWALWQTPELTNKCIKDWLVETFLSGQKSNGPDSKM